MEFGWRTAGRDVFVVWNNVEAYALQRTVAGIFFLGKPSWWDEYKSGRMLTVSILLAFSYYSNLVVLHQPRQGLM